MKKYVYEVPEEIGISEKKYLYVDESGIQGSGKGLFTMIDIFAGEKIAEYKGEIIDLKEFNARTISGKDQYFMNLHDGRTMDCINTKCFGKYANDAEGLIKSRSKNNSIITIDEKDHPCIVAIRKIKAGNEIFVSYGKTYWVTRNK